MSNQKLTEEQKQLVEDNIGLIYKASANYMKANKDRLKAKHLELQDLNQIGLEGVCKSIKGFNNKRGSLSSYIYTKAWFEISTQVNMYNQVVIPRKQNWELKSNANYKDELNNIYSNGVLSYNRKLTEENEGDFETDIIDAIQDETDSFENANLGIELNLILTDREIEIVKLYVDGYLQSELCKKYNVTKKTMVTWFNKIRDKIKSTYLVDIT